MKETDSKEESIVDDEVEILITEEDKISFKRLDQLLSDRIPNFSRTFIQNLFKKKFIQATEGEKLELKKLPTVGTKIIVQIPPPLPSTAKAEDIPINILYEDEHLLFVYKPAGMVTHPAPGSYTGTLVNALLFHCNSLRGIEFQLRAQLCKLSGVQLKTLDTFSS